MSSYQSPLKCLQSSSTDNSLRVNSDCEINNSGTSECLSVSTDNNTSYKSISPFQSPYNANYKSNKFSSTPNNSYMSNGYHENRHSTPRHGYRHKNSDYTKIQHCKKSGTYSTTGWYKPSMMEDPWAELMKRENISSHDL